MFCITNEYGEVLASGLDADDIHPTLDSLAMDIHAQAVAAGATPSRTWHRLMAIETSTGREMANLRYRLDPTKPYTHLAET